MFININYLIIIPEIILINDMRVFEILLYRYHLRKWEGEEGCANKHVYLSRNEGVNGV